MHACNSVHLARWVRRACWGGASDTGCVCLQTSHAFLEIAAVHAALPTLLAHPSFSKHSVAKVKDEMVLPMHAGYTGLQK